MYVYFHEQLRWIVSETALIFLLSLSQSLTMKMLQEGFWNLKVLDQNHITLHNHKRKKCFFFLINKFIINICICISLKTNMAGDKTITVVLVLVELK